MTGIYKITNKINGKFYIGLSNNIKRRWSEHKTPKNINRATNIAKAFRKYGIENFEFEVIEICEADKLAEREMYHIEKLKPEYNMNEGGVGNLGHKISDELKLHLKNCGKKQWESMTEEDKRRQISNNLKGPRIGHSVSDETREKLRLHNLGKKQSEETIEKRMSKIRGVHKENKHHFKRVAMVEVDTLKVVKEFESLKSAAEYVGAAPHMICDVLKGRRKTTKGYCWKYL